MLIPPKSEFTIICVPAYAAVPVSCKSKDTPEAEPLPTIDIVEPDPIFENILLKSTDV